MGLSAVVGAVALAVFLQSDGRRATETDAGRIGDRRECGADARGDLVADSRSVLPGMASWTARRNGRAFVQDNLWSHGGDQYAIWIAPGGRPIVARRSLTGGGWTTFDLSTIRANPLGDVVADPHHVFAIAVDRMGYVHVAGNMHGTALRYVRSLDPGRIDRWVEQRMVGRDENRVTYPAFLRGAEGELLFFYRNGSDGRGAVTVVNRFRPTEQRWERAAILADGRRDGSRPYLHHVATSRGFAEIHTMFLWRVGSGPESNRDVSYARSADNGSTWMTARGTTLVTPIRRATAEIIELGLRPDTVVLNQGGLAVDADGRPHAAFLIRPLDGEHASGVLHVWRAGSRWRVERIRLDGDPVGRPSVVADRRGRTFIVWVSRTRTKARVHLTTVSGRRGVDRALVRIPITDWEVTYDTTALAERGRLQFLVPVDALDRGGEIVGRIAVVSYDLERVVRCRPPDR
jgi:hypothetical protein